MAKFDRHTQGRISKYEGARFEKKLQNSFYWYRICEEAFIEKTPEPMRPIRSLRNGQFVAVFEGKGQTDYKGTLKGGRSIVLEAKYTNSDRLEYARVKPHQEAYLDEHEKLGAECFVIAGFESGKVYKIPWHAWKHMKKLFGHKYVTEEDLKGFRVKDNHLGVLLLL